MKVFSYLKSNYYTVDARTALLEGDVDVDEALSMIFPLKTNLERT